MPDEELRFYCPQLREKKFPTWQFPAVLKTNEVGFAGCAGDAGDLIYKVARGFYFSVVGCPFTAQKTSGGRGFIGPAIPNDFYVFKLAYPPNQCFDFLLFRSRRGLCGC